MRPRNAISPLMQELSGYIAAARRRALPAPVVEKTKHHVLDTLAAMVSGAKLLPGRKAIAYAKTLGGAREATVVGTKLMTSAVNAALANGMLAHSDETDDSHAPSLTHPGCGIVSAALAMAERGGRERHGVAARRGAGLRRQRTHEPGAAARRISAAVGHSTHSFGPDFRRRRGRSAALARSRRRTRCATRSPTPRSRLRPVLLHARHRAHREGVRLRRHAGAQRRRRRDHGGRRLHRRSRTCFPGERNFFVAYDESRPHRQGARPQRLVRGLGTTYEIMNTNIKRWSVGSPIQAPLDSLLDLIRAHGIKAGDVEKLDGARVAHRAPTPPTTATCPTSACSTCAR